MVICHSCKKLFSIDEDVLEFDLDGIKATLCERCYERLPKDKKKKLKYTGKKASMINLGSVFGFGIGGVLGGLAGGAGYQHANTRHLEKNLYKYGLDINKLDNYTINKFNCHFLLCNNKQQKQALSKFT